MIVYIVVPPGRKFASTVLKLQNVRTVNTTCRLTPVFSILVEAVELDINNPSETYDKTEPSYAG